MGRRALPRRGMIDFHTHILPGIDDGAATVEESVALLEDLSQQGVDAVLLTSHYYGRRRNVRSFLAEYDRVYSQLKKAYQGGIKLIRGAECNIVTCANSDFGELKEIAIEDTHYILTELSFEKKWTEQLWERIDNLLIEGLTPVIAHVELYPAVRKHREYAERLTEMGCLLQVNCDSLLQRKFRKILDFLFLNNLVSCLGTDTHNLVSRPPRYREATEMICEKYGRQELERIQEKMKTLLCDTEGIHNK